MRMITISTYEYFMPFIFYVYLITLLTVSKYSTCPPTCRWDNSLTPQNVPRMNSPTILLSKVDFIHFKMGELIIDFIPFDHIYTFNVSFF